jgi:hypothetical protein
MKGRPVPPMLEIEEAFVWPEGDRPDMAHDNFDFQLPVIDLSPVFKLERLRKEIEDIGPAKLRPNFGKEVEACKVATAIVVNDIRDACEEYGFFQITNHGFPMEVTEQLYECSKYIFGLPLEVLTL